jgi:hypothetical protein
MNSESEIENYLITKRVATKDQLNTLKTHIKKAKRSARVYNSVYKAITQKITAEAKTQLDALMVLYNSSSVSLTASSVSLTASSVSLTAMREGSKGPVPITSRRATQITSSVPLTAMREGSKGSVLTAMQEGSRESVLTAVQEDSIISNLKTIINSNKLPGITFSFNLNGMRKALSVGYFLNIWTHKYETRPLDNIHVDNIVNNLVPFIKKNIGIIFVDISGSMAGIHKSALSSSILFMRNEQDINYKVYYSYTFRKCNSIYKKYYIYSRYI